MQASAVLFETPRHVALTDVLLRPVTPGDVVVDVEWSGISTGTERLLWMGEMPVFPGLGYPLVPGYEAVGRIAQAPADGSRHVGERVFVPGSQSFATARGLFGASASRLIVPADRAKPIPERLGREAVLFALAATAHHAIASGPCPDLIVGHGVLGRLAARLAVALGGSPPVVWEKAPERQTGASGYRVTTSEDDDRRDYRTILDCSGDAGLIDTLVGRLAPGGELVLAGFYKDPIRFAFPPAFMRELRLRVAAEWREPDFEAVRDLVAAGRLSLGGLLTHAASAAQAPDAYRTAFAEADCLKMVLDWTVV